MTNNKNVYGIIYKVTCDINGKVYIGQTTKTLYMRKAQHKCRLKYNDKRTIFSCALIDEGFENFTWEIVAVANNQDELDRKEEYYIKKYKSNDLKFGYNDRGGGTYFKMSLLQKQKLSLAHKGKIVGDSTRQKLRIASTGRKHTNETKRKISVGHKGKKLTEEHKQKLSVAKRGKKLTEETKKKLRMGMRKGSKNGRAVLTETDVLKIKIMIGNGVSVAFIAQKYKVSLTTVYAIKRGVIWGWLVNNKVV
jgi:group I intron endonuclease